MVEFGFVVTMGNVGFYRLGQNWYTPLVDKSGVLGVMRCAVIQSGLLGDVKERLFTNADLDFVNGLITTNAVRGITAMSMLNGRQLTHLLVNLSIYHEVNL